MRPAPRTNAETLQAIADVSLRLKEDAEHQTLPENIILQRAEQALSDLAICFCGHWRVDHGRPGDSCAVGDRSSGVVCDCERFDGH